mmetsp:Transcript_1285/g.3043  ORF Transcript_1285/g.3043 Transcript_1285/m.3043 type:complete len:127 (+) Transcript_1285:210-590(+)
MRVLVFVMLLLSLLDPTAPFLFTLEHSAVRLDPQVGGGGCGGLSRASTRGGAPGEVFWRRTKGRAAHGLRMSEGGKPEVNAVSKAVKEFSENNPTLWKGLQLFWFALVLGVACYPGAFYLAFKGDS